MQIRPRLSLLKPIRAPQALAPLGDAPLSSLSPLGRLALRRPTAHGHGRGARSRAHLVLALPRLSGRRAKPGSSAVCFVPAREALSSLGPRPLLTKPPLGLHPSGLNTAPKPLARTSSEPRYSLCLSPVCQLRSAPTFVCRCSWWSPHERRFLNVCPANG